MVKNLIRAPESISVWEKNIKEMRRYQPVLASVLDAYVEENGHDFEHWKNSTANGAWIEGLSPKPFFQSAEEYEFPWNNKKNQSDPTFFLFGVGAPPFLFKAIRSLPKKALSLIVFEPNISLLAYTLHLTHVYTAMGDGCALSFFTLPEESADKNEEAVLKRRRVTRSLLDEALTRGLVTLGIFTAALAVSAAHPGEAESEKNSFLWISEQVREWVGVRLSSLGNSAEDTLLGLRQMALMTPWLVNGSRFTPLLQSHRGRPFICVAAGPSLDKNLHLLKDVQDQCVIMAADAVLRKLLMNGIRPHIVTALERGNETYDCFFADITEEYPEECAQILLIPQSVCVPRIAGRWPGPKTMVGKKGLPVDEWFVSAVLQRELVPAGSSVAHMNYGIALMMGASSIALIGQDLAFGEDGSTHAGDTAREDVMNITKQSTLRQKLPGSLGGEVESEHIWVFFLRILEQFIEQSKVETWDCTEGGALILGTRIHPLQQYLEEKVYSLEPFEQTPGDVVASNDKERQPDTGEYARWQSAYGGIRFSRQLLEDLERQADRVTAPGLSPEKRVALAQEAGRLLDQLHGENEVLSFIGQSYTYLASLELAKTRLLDSVDAVERWEKMHREVVDGHRLALDFMEKWLTYADEARTKTHGGEHLSPIPQAEALDRLLALLEREQAGEDITFDLDLLLARCDLLQTDASGYVLWRIASHLMTEGRAEDAAAYMGLASKRFDEQEMPMEQIIRFFKDYARILATHDLCHNPNYAEAEIMLAQAMELAPQDLECRQILGDILGGRLRFVTSILPDGSEKWMEARAVGAQALAAGKLDVALDAVWVAIRDHWRSAPGWAASHLDWLTTTLFKTQHAEDATIQEATERILKELVGDTELLSGVRLRYSREMIDLFIAHGLQVEVDVLEEEPVESEVVEGVETETEEVL